MAAQKMIDIVKEAALAAEIPNRKRKAYVPKKNAGDNTSMKKPKPRKSIEPRKYLICNQIYTVNWSGTKNILMGLDINNEFEPLLNIAQCNNAKHSGIYLSQQEFSDVFCPDVINFVERYFHDPAFQSNSIDITKKWTLDFRNYYNNKSIVLVDESNKFDENFQRNSIILQEPSWKMILKFKPAIEASFDVLIDYQTAAVRAIQLIINDMPITINAPDQAADSEETKIRRILNEINHNDLSVIHNDIKLATKVLNEIKIFHNEKLVSYLIKRTKFLTPSNTSSSTQYTDTSSSIPIYPSIN